MRKQDLDASRQARLVPVIEHPGAYALVPPPTPFSIPVTGAENNLMAAYRALGAIAEKSKLVPNIRLLTRTLDRHEAVLSSQIEGTHTSDDQLFEYETTGDDEGMPVDVRVTLNYVAALDKGVQAVGVGNKAITKSLIQELHRTLMQGVKDYKDIPGDFRLIQNRVGGLRIYDARLVPPPADKVQECLDDLVNFLQYENTGVAVVPLVIRMAIAHAQFEAIHPFRDGNGRVGRLLLPIMMAAEGYPSLYISGFLKTNQREYYDSLLAVQTKGKWDRWLRFFSAGVIEACNDTSAMIDSLVSIRGLWEQQVSFLRSDASGRKLLDLLLESPVITVNHVCKRLLISFPAANSAVQQLEKIGILTPNDTKRNRVFVAKEIIQLLMTGKPVLSDNNVRGHRP